MYVKKLEKLLDLQIPGFAANTTRDMSTAQRKKRNHKRRTSRRMRAYNHKHSK